MKSREVKILATIAKYQKQITGWKFEPYTMPYTWYRINKPGEIPPHIAVGYLKEADFRNYEELQYLIRGIWDEQLNPPEFPDYTINIYYIDIES